jgi:hypothetical protein
VVPTLRAAKDSDAQEKNQEFDSWLKKCLAVVSGSRRINHAYVFPYIAQGFLGPARKGFWPGVIVIAQRIHRRASVRAPMELTVQVLPEAGPELLLSSKGSAIGSL